MITSTRAKREYGLNESDLSKLECKSVRNPHYRSAAPMRLYNIEDVKAAQVAKANEHKPTRQEKSRLEVETATARLAAFEPFKPAIAGNTQLPIQIWTKILLMLPQDAIRDACVVAKEICVVSSVCRDLSLAARDALLQLLPPPKNADLILASKTPMSLTLPRLKAVCAELSVPVTGTKPVLIVRILDALYLKQPSQYAPLSLILEAKRQQNTPWYKEESIKQLISAYSYRTKSSIWQARRMLLETFGDLESIPAQRPASVRNDICNVCNTNMLSTRCNMLRCARCCSKNNCPRHK